MTDADRFIAPLPVLVLWGDAWRRATFNTHPRLWVGYWTRVFRSSLHVPQYSDQMLFWLASPFAFSLSVTSQWVVVDNTTTLTLVHMQIEDSGVRITDYKVRYEVGDRGHLTFSGAIKSPAPDEVRRVCDTLAQQRLDRPPSYTYAQAYETARTLAEEAI